MTLRIGPGMKSRCGRKSIAAVLRFSVTVCLVSCSLDSASIGQDSVITQSPSDEASSPVLKKQTKIKPIFGDETENELPEVRGGRLVLEPISARSTQTDDIGTGSVPDGFRSEQPLPTAVLPETASDRIDDDLISGEPWDWSVVHWNAANTFSNPRYFEDRMLERHGHQRWGLLQPVASGIRFFSTIPMLTYLGTINHPCECEYTMGHYRSGSCAPTLVQRPPWDRRAVLAESAAVATGMLVLP